MSGGSAMNYLEELSTVVDRLTAEGYTDVFRAEAGALRALTHDALFRPEELAIDGVYREEGITNPDDEAIVFALRSDAQGIRGTYTVAYGPCIDDEDAAILDKLHDRRGLD